MGLILLGRILQAVITLIALRAITSLLSPDEMGRLSLVLALFSFVGLVFLNPVGMFINRRLHTWVENELIVSYMRYFIKYLIAISVLSALIILIISNFYTLIPKMSNIWLAVLLALTILFATLNGAFISYLNLLGHPRWFISLTVVTAVVNLCFSAILVVNGGGSAELWQVGQILGQAMIAMIAMMVFYHVLYPKQHISRQQSITLTKYKVSSMYVFVWPLAISVLLVWIQTQFYRFFIPEMLGLDVLGLFVVGYGVGAALMSMMESVLSAHFLPKFYLKISSELKYDKERAWQNYAAVMLPSLVLVAVFVSLLAEDLVRILLDEKYQVVVQFVVWGVIVEAMRVATATYSMAAHAYMQTNKLIAQYLSGAVTAPAAIFLLVPIMGRDGIGVGLAVAGFISLLVSFISMRFYFSVKTPWLELMYSFLFSIGLIVLFVAMYHFIDMHENMVYSILRLSFMGFIFLLLTFWIIRPYLLQKTI